MSQETNSHQHVICTRGCVRDEEEECAKEVCSLTMTADNCFFTVFMFIKLDCTRLIQESQCACTVLYPCTCEHMITTTESAVLLHAWVLTIRLYSIGAHFLWDCFCAETQQSRKYYNYISCCEQMQVWISKSERFIASLWV